MKFNVKQRNTARLAAVQALFAYDLKDAKDSQMNLVDFLEFNNKEQSDFVIDLPYFRNLYINTIAHLQEIDQLIVKYTEKDLNKIDGVEKATLRYSTYELLYTDLDNPIVINEAVKLVIELGGTNSHTFINSYLDKLAKNEAKRINNSVSQLPKQASVDVNDLTL